MKRANILFLITDQQQAATVGPTSPCRTPNLDQLSAEGVRFTRAYTVNAICSPTRASLFTGMLPHTHGMVDCTHTVEDYRARFRKGLTLWSQRLEQAGYRTGYFGKWHVERSNRLDEFGFSKYELSGSDQFKAYQESLRLPTRERGAFVKRHLVKQSGYHDCQLYGVIDGDPAETCEYYLYSRGIEFLREAAQDSSRPWCLVVSTTAPHDPYFALKTYYDEYPPGEIKKPPNFHDDLRDKPNIYRRMQEVWREMRWENFAEATACYYAICTLIDDQVGRIVNILKELEQMEETIVIFMSDHGEFMGAHGLMMKGVPAFEEGYKIPFIVRWPGGGFQGSVCEPVSIVDLAPTLLEMVGAEPIEGCEGRSLVPLLKGKLPSDWDTEAFAEFHGQRFFFTQRIVWGKRYKYVFNGFDYDELYDLEEDPYELRNLANDPAYRQIQDKLAARMWKRIHETGDHNMYNAHYGTLRFAPVGPNATT